jgi:hypothetical protein
MARASKKNTPKRRKTRLTLASGAAEMNGAASAAFAGRKAVEWLRSGRPREYEHDAIIKIAEDLILIGVDDRLARLVERVCHECKNRHIKVPRPTLLTEICRPIFLRAKSAEK